MCRDAGVSHDGTFLTERCFYMKRIYFLLLLVMCLWPMTFTHAVNDKSIKEPASIIMTVDDDHADTVFMESYLMPVLLLVIILAVMLGVIVYYLWIRHLFQRKELNLLREHNKLLENMPVFYAQVHVVLDKDGLLSDMHLLAGNDLTMPGSQLDVDGILDALKAGTLPLASLQKCAWRVLALVAYCQQVGQNTKA